MKGHTTVSSRSTRLLSIALASSLGVGLAGAAYTINPVPAAKYPAEEQWAPTPVPDRIVLTPTADTTSSQAVSWRTDATVETAVAQIAPTGSGPSFKDEASTVTAQSHAPVQADLGYPVTFHTATFEGLEAGATYLYRVGDGENWSEWQEFTTATAEAEDFSFIYYGDAQNDIKEHVSRVFRKAFRDRPAAEIILHAGDLVNTSTADSEWGEWFHAAGWIDGTITQIATPGNHEYGGGALAPYWDKQFDFPDNGPAELAEKAPETVYYVDYKGVRFVSLNTNLDNDEDMAIQAEWLDTVLAENPHTWSVLTFHHPVFATTGTRDNVRAREYFLPLIEEHDVDLVLQGHDHSYARGNLQNDRLGRSTIHEGTVFVVSVSGPKMYALNDGWNWWDNGAEWTSSTEYQQLYQLIDVSGDTISYEARTADGAFFDGFELTKNAKGVKRVVTVDESGRPVR